MSIWNALIESEAPLAGWVPTGDENVYLAYGDTESPLLPPGASLIAWHEIDGALRIIDLERYKALRPLGNDPETGAATGLLAYMGVMGHEPRQLTEDGALYPNEDAPLVIEVRHRLFEGESNPEGNGWGWRAEILGGAESRDPSARAIGIYSDAGCTQYLYTTGAFAQQASHWQVDAAGDPLTVWATEYNPAHLGYDNDARQNVHHAVLRGSAKEGFATLSANADSAVYYFWERPQGYVPPPDAQFVDTGLVITAQFGTTYQLSGVPDPALVPGQEIRFGDVEGVGESVFTQYWPTPATPSNAIVFSPFFAAPLGTKLYRFE